MSNSTSSSFLDVLLNSLAVASMRASQQQQQHQPMPIASPVEQPRQSQPDINSGVDSERLSMEDVEVESVKVSGAENESQNEEQQNGQTAVQVTEIERQESQSSSASSSASAVDTGQGHSPSASRSPADEIAAQPNNPPQTEPQQQQEPPPAAAAAQPIPDSLNVVDGGSFTAAIEAALSDMVRQAGPDAFNQLQEAHQLVTASLHNVLPTAPPAANPVPAAIIPPAAPVFAPADSSSAPVRPRVSHDYPGVVCNSCRSSATDLVRLCQSHGVPVRTLSRCSGCRAVFYCGRVCQKNDWSRHKSLCRHIRQMEEGRQGFVKFTQREGAIHTNPREGSIVCVHYVGKLPNGNMFDRTFDTPPADPHSAQRYPSLAHIHPNHPSPINDSFEYKSALSNQPPYRFNVGVGEVIYGLDLAIREMLVGERATLIISAEFAYGDNGTATIPPKSPLIFDIELLQVTGEHIILPAHVANHHPRLNFYQLYPECDVYDPERVERTARESLKAFVEGKEGKKEAEKEKNKEKEKTQSRIMETQPAMQQQPLQPPATLSTEAEERLRDTMRLAGSIVTAAETGQYDQLSQEVAALAAATNRPAQPAPAPVPVPQAPSRHSHRQHRFAPYPQTAPPAPAPARAPDADPMAAAMAVLSTLPILSNLRPSPPPGIPQITNSVPGSFDSNPSMFPHVYRAYLEQSINGNNANPDHLLDVLRFVAPPTAINPALQLQQFLRNPPDQTQFQAPNPAATGNNFGIGNIIMNLAFPGAPNNNPANPNIPNQPNWPPNPPGSGPAPL